MVPTTSSQPKRVRTMQTDLIKVTGMTCGGCVNSVTRALKAVPGVAEVSVSLQPGEAKVQFDEQIASPGQLALAVQGAGYGVEDTTSAVTPPAPAPAKGGCCN